MTIAFEVRRPAAAAGRRPRPHRKYPPTKTGRSPVDGGGTDDGQTSTLVGS